MPEKSRYRPDGFELWRGPSQIDGVMIGVVVTHVQRAPMNSKIGDMSQAWIMPLDTPPLDAVRSGADGSVCGSCRFRPTADGGCYVSIGNTAQRVWWAWRRNESYLPVDPLELPEELGEKPGRIGAWGDPAAVPVEAWIPLLAKLPSWTAYTQRWRGLSPADWSWCMASVESASDMMDARGAGWRTFRARSSSSPILPGEVVCPASNEGGHKAQCDRCGLCDGVRMQRQQPKDPVIIVHGHSRLRAERWVGPAPSDAPATPAAPRKTTLRKPRCVLCKKSTAASAARDLRLVAMSQGDRVRPVWMTAHAECSRYGARFERPMSFASSGRQLTAVEEAAYEAAMEVETVSGGAK